VASLPVDSSEELAHLGSVVERLPTGVILITERLEVEYANVAARRLLHPAKLTTRRALPDPWKSFSLRRYAEELIEHELSLETRVEVDGERIYLVDGLSARNEAPAAILLRDVTAHNRRGRAEREFVANASHELLTPLTGIVTAAHVLEAGAKDVPEDRDRFVAHIATECTRLARIARSLLVLARAQSGEESPRLEIVELRAVLAEVVELVDADVGIRCPEGVTVFADVDLLIQALTNLLANAAKHGPGAVAVEARPVASELVELDLGGDDRDVAQAGEFRRRFQSGAGRDGGGFGLGLSIAEQSLEVMGGHLLLDGDTVRVRIPAGGMSAR
jgi:signal transduction histidine kinase